MSSETTLERQVVRYVESIGGLAPKLILASESGFPDRTLILPGGRVLFAELKKPRGSRTYPMQRIWRQRLLKRGVSCEFITTMEEARQLICS